MKRGTISDKRHAGNATYLGKISKRICDISKPSAPTLRLLILLNGFSQNSS